MLHSHENAEKESMKLQKRRQISTTDATHVATISSYLKTEITFEETFGYETKFKRELFDIKKQHYIDAIFISTPQPSFIHFPNVIYKKVCVPLGDYKQSAGSRSEKIMPTGKIMGFRKFDKVEWEKQSLFIKGRMSTGYAILMDIDGNTVNFKPMPKLKIMKRITARKSCLMHPMRIENIL